MVNQKTRNSKKISKRKVLRMVELFEEKIDQTIVSINVELKYITASDGNTYFIDFSKNSVEKVYDDPDW